MTNAADSVIVCKERLELFRDQLMSVQSGHPKPYDMDDVMTFIATTSRVLLALVADLLAESESDAFDDDGEAYSEAMSWG